MKTSAFDYHLPPERIAQQPARRRDSSRLMLVERSTGRVSHHVFRDLPGLLEPGDCLVLNTSRVFPGRITARKEKSGGRVELLLLERLGEGLWRAMAGGARLRPGVRLELDDGGVEGEVVEGPVEGKAVVRFRTETPGGDPDALLSKRGSVPLPPYIKNRDIDPERYQTVYSERESSAAAPTAGLHFTGALLEKVRSRRIDIARLELAVGMDTFLPVREESVEEHRIHTEWFSIGEECAETVNRCRRRGGKAVAVGTTSVRALESAADRTGVIRARSGRTELFITPGYEFRAVDALITNFHFPRSTLLMLVCAFGGTDLIMSAYRAALDGGYRFYSFGDAMLVV